MTDKADFLPCPFCGGENIRDVYIRDGREIRCASCGGSVRAFHPDASINATLKWNTRNTELFVEQACEAVDEVITNSKAPGFNNGYDHCKVKVKQAIKDKFK